MLLLSAGRSNGTPSLRRLLHRTLARVKRRNRCDWTQHVFGMVETAPYKDEGARVSPDVAESVARTVKGAALESEGAAT